MNLYRIGDTRSAYLAPDRNAALRMVEINHEKISQPDHSSLVNLGHYQTVPFPDSVLFGNGFLSSGIEFLIWVDLEDDILTRYPYINPVDVIWRNAEMRLKSHPIVFYTADQPHMSPISRTSAISISHTRYDFHICDTGMKIVWESEEDRFAWEIAQ